MKKEYSNYLEFNLNHNILVELTDAGYNQWFKHWHKYDYLYTEVKPPETYSMEELKSKADKHGFVKFEMWEFMYIFGAVTGMGMPVYYYLTIMIKKEDLKEYKGRS